MNCYFYHLTPSEKLNTNTTWFTWERHLDKGNGRDNEEQEEKEQSAKHEHWWQHTLEEE